MMSYSVNVKLLVGALLLAVSILAGLIAAWLNVRSCPGPKERRLVAASTLVVWLLILSLFAAMYAIPPPWRYLLLIPYFVGVPVYVYGVSVRRQMLRILERRDAEETESKRR